MKKILFSLTFAVLGLGALRASEGVFQTPAGLLINNDSGAVTTEKLGFWGVTPVVQPTNASQAALTDNTTGAASGTTMAAGVGVYTLTFPIENASIANGDVVVAYVPGHKFKILKVTYVTNKPVTTGSKLSTITPKITGVAVTGGVLSLTSATMTPVGTLVAGTAVTAANTGSSTDSITLTASATTAFVEGNGSFVIQIQNMDSADAAAAIARQTAAFRTALVNLGLIKGS